MSDTTVTNDKLLLKLKQSKGEINRFRIFFNGELIDENETTTSWQDFIYDINIIKNDINFLIIQVLNEKTSVDDDRNILSSNSIHYSIDSSIKWNGYDFIRAIDNVWYIRDIDPIYEIYAKQKNIDYRKFYYTQYSSLGNGKFFFAFIPHRWYSPKMKNFRSVFHTGFYYNNETYEIYDEKTTKEMIIKKLDSHYDGEISPYLDVNIRKLLKYYNED